MHRVRTAAVFLVMSLTFLFGAAKFLDLPAFQRAVSTWDLIPEMARGITAATIPLLEMLFPGLWLVGVCRRQMLIVTLSLVTVFTVGFAIHWAGVGTADMWLFGSDCGADKGRGGGAPGPYAQRSVHCGALWWALDKGQKS
jgi:hypothetical protein